MPKYSNKSKEKLETCHSDLQTLFHYVIRYFDCTILYGFRTSSEQFELYKQGRVLEGDLWLIEDKNKIITYKDGYQKKSKHNYNPSFAVDVVPYPIEWKNVDRMRFFVGYVLGVAQMLKAYGAMNEEITSGIDWDSDTILRDQRFNDLPHFQIK